jgi:hypothetical protein
MVDGAIGGEAAHLPSVGAQDSAVVEPPDYRHAVTAGQRADLVARPVDDDACALSGTPAFMEQEIGRQACAMLCADAGAGGERAGKGYKTENEAPPRARSAKLSISSGHDWTPSAQKRRTLREEQLHGQQLNFFGNRVGL